MKPLVSVIIPAYNEEKYLSRCLESVLKQDFKQLYEVIVVDNRSTDHTAAIAEKLGVKVIREKRRGIAYARQAGLLAAKGEIVCGTDADTIVPNDWITHLCRHFRKGRKVIAVGGGFDFYDSQSLGARFFCKLTDMYGRVSNVFFLPALLGFNHSFRRREFLKLGGYDPHFQTFEDVQAAIRLNAHGRVVFDPAIIVHTSFRRMEHSSLKESLLQPALKAYQLFFMNQKVDHRRKAYR